MAALEKHKKDRAKALKDYDIEPSEDNDDPCTCNAHAQHVGSSTAAIDKINKIDKIDSSYRKRKQSKFIEDHPSKKLKHIALNERMKSTQSIFMTTTRPMVGRLGRIQ
jgi:hypothetical protein